MHFLHFVFKVFDHLYSHYSKFFSRYFGYFPFIYLNSVFLVCSFISVGILCLFIIFLTYYVWGLLFPSFKVEFFLLFGFCPIKVGPVVCVSLYRVRFVLSFCLFVFPLKGKAEWDGNPVCFWLGLYFCFVCCLDEASCTAGWCWVLYSSGFFRMSSHYLILPRVSSLVV